MADNLVVYLLAWQDMNKEEQQKDFILRQKLKATWKKDPEGRYKISQNKVVKLG